MALLRVGCNAPAAILSKTTAPPKARPARALGFQARGAGYVRPADDFAADEGGELVRSGVERLVALLAQGFDRFRRMHRLVRGRGELFDDRPRGACGREEPE